MLIHGVELAVHPDRARLFDGLATPARVLERFGASIPPADRRSAVAELKIPEGHFFLKVYAYSGLWRLRTFGVASRAGREYRNLLKLAELGFSVPRPAAWGQARTLGFLSESFVMTDAIENPVSIWTYVYEREKAAFPWPPRAERLRLMGEFARSLRRAHDEGFFIHTLRSKNVLLTRDGDHYRVNVIDVPFAGIWRWRLMPRMGRVRDLASLMKWGRALLSRAERMRFAKLYGADRDLLRSAQAYQEKYYP